MATVEELRERINLRLDESRVGISEQAAFPVGRATNPSANAGV